MYPNINRINDKDVKMDDEGGSSHLSMSVMYREATHFHDTPLLMTRTGAMADCCKTSIC
ncbi:MAG: hypothetical protein ABR534_08120 [Desulfotignum sp.]